MESLQILALGLIHLASLVAAGHALLTKNDPRAALGWTVALIFLPVVGLVSYLIFGISRAHSRAEIIMRRIARISKKFVAITDQLPPQSLATEEARCLDRLGHKLANTALCGGNKITPLYNGDEAYPTMIAAINAAREHVYLGTYIFNYGHAAEMFIAALTAAHDRGVDVRVLVDGVGCLYSWRKPVKILAARGIKTTLFRPLRLNPPNFGINLRSHRKVLICDDTAFTGGMNISDGNLLKYNPHRKHKIQDIQFHCQGPAVSQLRRAFLLNWAFCTDDFTPLPPGNDAIVGACDCRVVVDGPGKDGDALCDLICGAVNIARSSVIIMTPYFLPPEPLRAALISAGQRGVNVRVILPGHNNLAYMSWATTHVLPRLLQAGIRVWHQVPPFAHTKLLAIDGFYSLIGSANMDSRSLRLNFELNMEIYNAEFHDRIVDFMDKTIASGREILLAELKSLSLPLRLRNAASWIFSPYF